MPKKGKKPKAVSIPRVVDPYWDERDVTLKYLNIFQLRDFCIKLYKTLQPLAAETEKLLYKRKRLLWYWRFEHKKLWNEIKESQRIDMRHMRKRFKEEMALMQIRDKKMRCVQSTYKSRIHLSKQKTINNMIIHRFKRKRLSEYQAEAHRFDKEILARIFKHDIMLMDYHVQTIEGYHKIFYDFGDLILDNELKYSQGCLERLKLDEEKLVKQENVLISRKGAIRGELIAKWEKRKNEMRTLYEDIIRINVCNRRTIKQKLADAKWNFLLAKKMEREMKDKVDSIPDLKSVLDEKNKLLDIIELKSFYESKLKRYRKEFNEMDNSMWNLRKENVELISKEKEREDIHDLVKDITMENIDRTIVMHMGRKILAQLKDNYLVKKIRVFHYILTELLKVNDEDLNNLILNKISEHKAVVSLENSCEYYDDRTKFNYKKIRFDTYNYDPFQMNVVDNVAIRNSDISSSSLFTSYKDFMKEQQHKEIDVYHEEPDKLLNILDNVNLDQHMVRNRMECIFRKNYYNVNSFPIRINEPYAIGDEKYVREWEDALFKLLIYYGFDVGSTDYGSFTEPKETSISATLDTLASTDSAATSQQQEQEQEEVSLHEKDSVKSSRSSSTSSKRENDDNAIEKYQLQVKSAAASQASKQSKVTVGSAKGSRSSSNSSKQVSFSQYDDNVKQVYQLLLMALNDDEDAANENEQHDKY